MHHAMSASPPMCMACWTKSINSRSQLSRDLTKVSGTGLSRCLPAPSRLPTGSIRATSDR